MSGAPWRGADRHGGGRPSPLVQACWNLRYLALFLLGPAMGVVLAGGIFGMPLQFYGAAGVVFIFTLSMYAVLIRSEWKRVVREGDPARRPS